MISGAFKIFIHCLICAILVQQLVACSSSIENRITKEAAPFSVTAGGLVAYPVPEINENLLLNPGFEPESDGLSLGGWKLSAAFSTSSTEVRDGKSLQMKDAPDFPYSESARQEIFLKKGSYRFGGWLKTAFSDPGTSKGVRFSIVNVGSTQIVSGTSDWQLLEAEKMYVPQDGNYQFKVEAYSEPTGAAWFDDVFIKRESYPLEVFLVYPNYRGMLFDDQSQEVMVSVNTDLPDGKGVNDYRVKLVVVDEVSGNELVSQLQPAKEAFIGRVDFSTFTGKSSYLLSATLLDAKSGETIYSYPAYRIVKLPGSLRKEMAVSFDVYNRFLVRDIPTFWLGVYDSGMGYPATESQWTNNLTDSRRLFELPINLYLNYWYGQASLTAMQTMMNVLQKYGIYYLQTGNAFNTSYDPNSFLIDTDVSYLKFLSEHPGLAGFYTVDEAVSSLAPTMFEQYWRLKSAKPDGMTFAALLNPNGLRYWRDTVDVLSMDPYPLAGAEPAGGYNLAQVGDWTRATKDAVMDSRPFMTVLQFFKQTSKGRFPTKDELRNMSYMAITEGANGLMYWSLGVNALSYVCSDWCDDRVTYFESLKSVMTEIKGLEPALTSIDHPELLTENSNASDIRTRVKFINGKGYLFAYNYMNTSTSATFSWSSPLGTIKVYNEGREISSQGNQFTDIFDGFEAHVYEITASTR